MTGYAVYVNGSLAGTTAATQYALTGLTCGTSYQLGVEAIDAAGNLVLAHAGGRLDERLHDAVSSRGQPLCRSRRQRQHMRPR